MSPSVSLVEVSAENWRDIADLAPRDDQRAYVAPLAARYLLLGVHGTTWHNLGAYDGDTPVGHVMWGTDDDGSRWIGGLLIDAAHQGRGLGRAVVAELVARLRAAGDTPIRLSHDPDNVASRSLFESLGFVATGAVEDGEVVLELAPGTPMAES
jgi:diamine N-acetyltransferase